MQGLECYCSNIGSGQKIWKSDLKSEFLKRKALTNILPMLKTNLKDTHALNWKLLSTVPPVQSLQALQSEKNGGPWVKEAEAEPNLSGQTAVDDFILICWCFHVFYKNKNYHRKSNFLRERSIQSPTLFIMQVCGAWIPSWWQITSHSSLWLLLSIYIQCVSYFLLRLTLTINALWQVLSFSMFMR